MRTSENAPNVTGRDKKIILNQAFINIFESRPEWMFRPNEQLSLNCELTGGAASEGSDDEVRPAAPPLPFPLATCLKPGSE
jgi:hypothetical protein